MRLDFEEFDQLCQPVKTVGRNDILFWAVGLGGESGEALNLIKKMERDGNSEDLDQQLLTECGDILFYLKQVLKVRGFKVEDAAKACLIKLAIMQELLYAEDSGV